MANEERLMILQMVSEGRITAAEAAELIKALGETPKAQGAGTQKSGDQESSWLGRMVEDLTSGLSNLAYSTIGPKHEFPAEHTGELPAQGDINLHLHNGNGRIHLATWDQPTYKANLTVEVRAKTREEAEKLAEEAYTFAVEGGDFRFRTKNRGEVAVHVDLMLPKDRFYKLEASTGNGGVKSENVTFTDVKVTTGNGGITWDGGEAKKLTVRTGNGGVRIQTTAEELDAGTGNGSITCRPTGAVPQDVKLTTGNGSIKVITAWVAPECGLRVDAHTGMGGIGVDAKDLVYERNERALGHKHVIAHSANWNESDKKIAVRARTGMGSISIE